MINITELKQKRKQKFETFMSNRKTRSRLEGVLTAKNFDLDTMQKLTKVIPKKDLLKCSAELHDLYIKDHFKP